MYKKLSLILVCLTFVMLFVNNDFTYAAVKNPDDDGVITGIYVTTPDGLKEISLSEYQNILRNDLKESGPVEDINEPAKESEINPDDVIGGDWYRYDESSHSLVNRTDLRKRVSTILYNDTSTAVPKSITFNATQGYQINISVTSDQLNSIKSGVSFTWYNSASRSETHTVYVQPHMYGWIEFYPRMNKSVGTLKHFNLAGQLIDQKSVTAYSPNKIEGYLDGIYIAKEGSTPPSY